MRVPRALIGIFLPLVLVGPAFSQGGPQFPGEGRPAPRPSQAQPSGPAQMAQKAFAKGMDYQKKGKFNEAIQEFKVLIKLLPKQPIGYANVAMCYIFKGDPKSAQYYVNKVDQLDPSKDPKTVGPRVQLHFMLGRAYLVDKNVSAAMREYQVVASLDPKNVRAHYNLAIMYADAGQFTKARASAAKAAALAPKDPSIWGLRAMIEERADKVNGKTKALAIIQKAAAANPKSWQIQFELGNRYERVGKPDKAKECYKKVIALQPSFTLAKIKLAEVFLGDRTSKYANEGYRKAQALLLPIVKKDPKNPQPITLLGLSELYLGHNEEAEKYYKQAYQLAPTNPMVLQGLVYIYQTQQKPKIALEYLEKLNALQPGDVELSLRLAGMYDQTGDTKKALALYQEIVEKNPKDTEAMAARAQYLNQQKFTEKAAEQYRDILKIKPDDLDTQMKIAQLYMYNDDKAIRDNAVPELETAKKFAKKMKPPEDTKQSDPRLEPFRSLANLYGQDKETAKAAQQYKEFLEFDPKSVDAQRSLAQTYQMDDATIDDAIAAFKKLIEMKPDEMSSYTSLGAAIKKKTGKSGDEIVEYRKYVEAGPKETTPRLVLANALSGLEGDNLDEAIKQYEEILKIKVDDEQAMMGIAKVYDKQNKPDEAYAQYKKVLTKDPGYQPALRAMQTIANNKNDPKTTDDWLAFLKTLIGKKDVNAGTLYTYILDDYTKANREAEAVAILEAAMKKDPKDMTAFIVYGGHCEKTNQYAKGLAIYKKVTETSGVFENYKGQAYKGMGNIYFAQHKWADARKSFKEWKSRQMFFFGVDDAQVKMAQCLEYLGKTDEALAEFTDLKNGLQGAQAGDPKMKIIQEALERLDPKPTTVPGTIGPGGQGGPM